MSAKPRRGEQFLNEIAELTTARLGKTIELPQEVADAVGRDVAKSISERWGGEVVYVSTGWLGAVSTMHQNLYNDYRSGMQIHALRKKYGISQVWVYAIIRDMRKKHLEEVQKDIFDECENEKVVE